jgi:uncharacterized integral membrane protein
MQYVIGLPLLVILLLFALSNKNDVILQLWPTDFTVQTPLAIAILAAAAFAFLVGALFTWFGGMGHRRRARRAEDTVRLLEGQVAALKARLPVTATSGSTSLSRVADR